MEEDCDPLLQNSWRNKAATRYGNKILSRKFLKAILKDSKQGKIKTNLLTQPSKLLICVATTSEAKRIILEHDLLFTAFSGT